MLQRSRVLVCMTFTAVCFLLFLLEIRIIYLQTVDAPALAARATRYRFGSEEVPAPRGAIVDARGEALAVSVPAMEVWADNRYLQNPWTKKDERKETLGILSRLLGLDPVALRDDLSRSVYRPVDRNVVDAGKILALYELKQRRYLRGIQFERKYVRRYPMGNLLGHTLGFTNMEGHGVCGVEKRYDAFLRGRAGRRTFERDGVQNEIYNPCCPVTPAQAGGSIRLTVDGAIQLFTEVEVARVAQRFDPAWVAAVVMDPFSGRILAAASLPALDPADPGRGRPDRWMNRVFAARYTPGSTFKPIIMAMAVERGKVDLEELIDCEGGTWYYEGRRISDVHVNYRQLTPAGVLFKSSNIGISKIGLRLVPPDTPKGGAAFRGIIDTLRLLGFDRKPGVLCPEEETEGTLSPLRFWTRKYTLVSVSFGNEIAVSPVQMAAALCTLVNGGVYIPPRIVESFITPEGRVIPPPRAPSCRVFSPRTSEIVKEMLVRVVEEGTGRRSRIEGVRVGGKTGTAEKLPDRKEVTASFVAFAPAERPRLLVLLVVDEPHGRHYASIVAAPAVKAILERSLSHLCGSKAGVAAGERRGDREGGV